MVDSLIHNHTGADHEILGDVLLVIVLTDAGETHGGAKETTGSGGGFVNVEWAKVPTDSGAIYG